MKIELKGTLVSKEFYGLALDSTATQADIVTPDIPENGSVYAGIGVNMSGKGVLEAELLDKDGNIVASKIVRIGGSSGGDIRFQFWLKGSVNPNFNGGQPMNTLGALDDTNYVIDDTLFSTGKVKISINGRVTSGLCFMNARASNVPGFQNAYIANLSGNGVYQYELSFAVVE